MASVSSVFSIDFEGKRTLSLINVTDALIDISKKFLMNDSASGLHGILFDRWLWVDIDNSGYYDTACYSSYAEIFYETLNWSMGYQLERTIKNM